MALPRIYFMAAYSFAVVLVLALSYVSGDDIIGQEKLNFHPRGEPLPQEEIRRPLQQNHLPSKRPFCNAFAGCGRKRSVDAIARLFDFNPEPAVEELNKRILSEAKRLEAIREARAAVARSLERFSDERAGESFGER